ncbi:MAG TPA: zinc ribbon domain-containing protein [Planctomycetota bacterium]|nr:zinc ribbon domain-containing protein [Planctomycetota bacterium]
MATGRECPACHRVNRPGARACEECGFDFITGRAPAPKRSRSGESQPGVFGLAVGTLVHPVRTMDAFFYYVNDTAMLGKMAIFFLVSLPIAGLIAAGGETGRWVQGTFAEAVGFAVSTICIVLAGRIIGQSSSLIGAAAILGFVRAVVTFVSGLWLLAIITGLTGASFFVILIFLIWGIVLNIVALTNIFGCSGYVAFFISLVAGILQWFITKAVGVAG